MMPAKKNPFAMQNPAGSAKPAAIEAKPQEQAQAQPEDAVTMKVSKLPTGKFKSSLDDGDELGPQEQEHDSAADAGAAFAQKLEEKYGEAAVEDAEEKVDPGIHKEAGDYLSKMAGKQDS